MNYGCIKDYACEIKAGVEEPYTMQKLLNGAKSWQEYSYDGNSLIWDADIRERLGVKCEGKKLLDLQAEMLEIAAYQILMGGM